MSELYLQLVRQDSNNRLALLKRELGIARDILQDDGTIFATGSYGRLEASSDSDLDVFVGSLTKDTDDLVPKINDVRQIRLKSELIIAAQKAGMADFDGGGKFLATHLSFDLINEVGSPSDDFKNTFTGRMLLILESQPVLGEDIYVALKKSAINCYFNDYEGLEEKFVPYFFINDVLRMWRTFCVNYEHFRAETSDYRVKNLKLKYMRMLTCYSAIIYVAAVYQERGTVSPEDIFQLSSITPIERLLEFGPAGRFEAIGAERNVFDTCKEAVAEYGEFLEFVQEKRKALRALKRDEDEWRARSYQFGGKIVKLIHDLSGDDFIFNPVYRSILV